CVPRHLVVSGASREVAGGGVVGPRQRAVGDAVAIDVAVPSPLAGQPLQVVFRQHLAAVEVLVRVFELGCHPEVHPEVQVGEDELMARAPAQPAPMAMPTAASSSSACTTEISFSPVCVSTRKRSP